MSCSQPYNALSVFRSLLLFFAFSVTSILLYSQQTQSWYRTIEWGNSRPRPMDRDSVISYSSEFRYLYFDKAIYPDIETFFPYYFESVPAEDFKFSENIRIDSIEYETLTKDEIKNILYLENLGNDFLFEHFTAYDKGRPLVQIKLLPLRKNANSGEIEKITAFYIKFTAKPEPSVLKTTRGKSDYAANSVLASGKWYKIKIVHDGIYKLTYDDLVKIGFSNPENIRIYGNGGRVLPLMNSVPRPDDLQENAIYMDKGTDGVFNKGDFILFYGKGTVTWEYDTVNHFFYQHLHDYADTTCYFLTTDLGPGKKITGVPQAVGIPDNIVTTFDDYNYHEKNINNLIHSGRQWFGDNISGSSPYSVTFDFPNIVVSEPVKLKVNIASRSDQSSRNFTIKSNDKYLGTINILGVFFRSFTGTYANQKSGFFSFLPSSEQVNVNITFNRVEMNDLSWLDYITVNARRNLIMNGNAMFFRDAASVGAGKISRFIISGASGSAKIWDITDLYNVKQIEATYNNNSLNFSVETDTLREFVVLNPQSNFLKPITEGNNVGWVTNQNLHGYGSVQMLIVTDPLFIEQAEELAELHREKDQLSVLVVTTTQIFNEFSTGIPDVSAIRDFARMLYKRGEGTQQQLKYLLLFGDGSFYNHLRKEGNTNKILTYQSLESLNHSTSYVSDDFFGYLDDNEGGSDKMASYYLDIGIGRLTVNNIESAQNVVNKIKQYYQSRSMRDWRNKIMFVADDGELNDDTIFMNHSNSLATWVSTNYPSFIVKKVMLDAYRQVSTATGARYPDVNKTIYDNIHNGLLIFNYTGHGGEKGLSAEQILIREELLTFTNRYLPLFITATCEFSRFDDISISDKGVISEYLSAGEASLINPNGGSIGLVSTTRVVYADNNQYLNTQFYNYAFQRDENGKYLRLGDIMRLTKNSLGIDQNKLNFILLCDPAIRLPLPEFLVFTDSLNGQPIDGPIDTLKAFKEISIKGHIADLNTNKISDFNGIVYPTILDKAIKVKTLGNDGINTMEFYTQENVIYKGKAQVINGDFSFSFIVPKDIIYSYGNGKISFYAHDSLRDASGYCASFIAGGTNTGFLLDENGPEIELYINDANFVNGGITDKNPVIFARLHDESGINTTGSGIGHDIVGIIDGKVSQPYVMNDFYETSLNDFRNGTLYYPLAGLSVGKHSVLLRAWDIYNNPSEAYIEFEVVDKSEIFLRNVYNYPNPAKDYTYFQFEHNKSGTDAIITIDIYNLSGRIVRTIKRNIYMEGYHSSPIEWDLKDNNGNSLANGLYPYRIRVEINDGLISYGFNKITIIKH